LRLTTKHNVNPIRQGTIFAVGAILLLSLFASVGSVSAMPSHPTFGTFVNSAAIPAGSTLVLKINYKVTNDEDSGFVGFWALDNYNKQVQVWQDPTNPNLFYVVARYEGNWNTFAGALSPAAGLTESTDASGTFQGGWAGTFTATGMVSSPSYPTFGNIGTFNFGGTKSDVLLGTYGAGQTGPTTIFDWVNTFFTGASSPSLTQWGWTYHYKSQTWNNFYYCTQSGGATPCPGDIVT